ncbi:hypothetical protein H5410_034165 [Solanum commersonii]|uniref:Uncharacterized protein n=1 Tax=Solanum commersonii TaxID=4109 RepID=A0A9J5YPW5_SOLCO|nr:hypothetical protein H5410_034165 [Solanum commersonii]
MVISRCNRWSSFVPFVGAADSLGAASGLPLDLFAGPGDALEPSSSKKSDSTGPETRSSASSILGFAAVT